MSKDTTTEDVGTDAIPVLAGDWSDDDGAVFDSLYADVSEPPHGSDLPGTAKVTTGDEPKATTRLLTGSLTFPAGSTWGPQMILPADPNRSTVRVKAASSVSTDVIEIADDSGKLVTGGAYCLSGGETFDMINHTGAVWVAPHAADGIAGPVGVVQYTWSAVTK